MEPCRIFVFTISHEIQTGCASEWFHIGSANKYNFITALIPALRASAAMGTSALTWA
jgi:hypothetical protein